MQNHHTHPDDRLTFGCPACTEYVRADQLLAEIESAPLRRCHWTAAYGCLQVPHVVQQSLTFTTVSRVVPGWTADEVVERHYGDAFEQFAMSLPDDWTWDEYDLAFRTATLTVKIGGAVVPDLTVTPAPALDVPLFDIGNAS